MSPKGITSGLRMLIFLINRAGRGSPGAAGPRLERAKGLMLAMVREPRKEVAAPRPAPTVPGRSGTRA